MRTNLLSISKNEKGFTLIEILITIMVTGIILYGITMAISQLFTVNAASMNHMKAVKQVENALHYLDRDGQQAWPSLIQPVDTDKSTFHAFPLNLQWTDNDSVTVHNVSYIYDASTRNLQRSETITGQDAPVIIQVATDIDAAAYNFCHKVLTINLTASVSGFRAATETRTLQVKPRTDR